MLISKETGEQVEAVSRDYLDVCRKINREYESSTAITAQEKASQLFTLQPLFTSENTPPILLREIRQGFISSIDSPVRVMKHYLYFFPSEMRISDFPFNNPQEPLDKSQWHLNYQFNITALKLIHETLFSNFNSELQQNPMVEKVRESFAGIEAELQSSYHQIASTYSLEAKASLINLKNTIQEKCGKNIFPKAIKIGDQDEYLLRDKQCLITAPQNPYPPLVAKICQIMRQENYCIDMKKGVELSSEEWVYKGDEIYHAIIDPFWDIYLQGTAKRYRIATRNAAIKTSK